DGIRDFHVTGVQTCALPICIVLFLFTIVPEGAMHWTKLVLGISLFGALYAAVIAFRQDDFKRLVAYSSMSHMGLMCAALFTWNRSEERRVGKEWNSQWEE